MSRIFLLLGCLALVAAAIFWITTASDFPPDQLHRSGFQIEEDATISSGAEDTGIAETPLTRIPADKLEAVNQARDGGANAPALVTIQGRCLSAEDKAPLVGVEILLIGRRNQAAREAEGEVPAALDLPAFLSDAAGRFRLELEATPFLHFILTIKASGRTSLRRYWDAPFAAGEVIDLGDLNMSAGAMLSGIVLDEDGHPLVDVDLNLRGVPRDFHGMSVQLPSAFSDEQGHYSFSAPLPLGTWDLTARREGYSQLSPHRVSLPDARQPVSVEVRMTDGLTISGHVVDEAGKGVPGVYVDALSFAGERALSDDQGAFHFALEQQDQRAVRLTVAAKGYQYYRSKEAIAWGTKDVTVQLERGIQATVRVVEKETGKAVEDFLVKAKPKAGGLSRQLGGRGPIPDGRLIMEGLEPARFALYVVPAELGLAPAGPLLIDLSQGAVDVTMEVTRLSPLKVRVLGPDGLAVAGAKVSVIDRAKTEQDVLVEDFRSGSLLFDEQYVRQPQVLSSSLSDDAGLASLFALPAQEGQVLRVDSSFPLHEETLHLPFDKGEVLIRLSPLGILEATLVRGLGMPARVALAIGKRGNQVRDTSFERLAEEELTLFDGNNQARIEGILPGSYAIHLYYPPRPQEEALGLQSWWRMSQSVAEDVTIVGGESTQVTLQGESMGLGSLRAAVEAEGEPAANTEVWLVGKGNDPNGDWLRLTSDMTGVVTAEGLPLGRYEAKVRIGEDMVEATGEVEIHAGTRSEGRFQADVRTWEVELEMDDGSVIPAGSKIGRIGVWFSGLRTDAPNHLVVKPAPAKLMVLYFHDAERRMWKSEAIPVETTSKQRTLQVRLFPTPLGSSD